MVQAILAGRKTQTRRVIKFPEDFDGREVYKNGHFGVKYSREDGTLYRHFPKYQPGDILYVRETFRKLVDCKTGDFHSYDYKADMPEKFHRLFPYKWQPSLFMPKDAARIFLQVTDVRAERLQDITDKDAVAEGVKEWPEDSPFGSVDEFPSLWDGIHAWKNPSNPKSFDSNPWVWVYTFKKIENPNQ